jgi:hypothetical protein
MNALLEQAARVLDHQPARSMHAEPLYRKAVRECGVEIPFSAFMEALTRHAGTFTVIRPDPVAGLTEGWDARHRSQYRAALEAAGLAEPLVVLTTPGRDPGDAGGAAADGAAATAAAGAEAVLGDVHDALTHLLHAADAGDPLYQAVAGAVEELQVLRRVIAT